MSPDDFRKLVAAGLSSEQIALVMEMMDGQAKVFEQAEEARKAKGRERVAKWRETKVVTQRNVTETSPKVTELLVRDRVAPVDDKPITTSTTGSKNTTAARDLAEFRATLASLDAPRLDGLITLRRSKKAPVTGHAAGLFIKAAKNCGLSLQDAADISIERSWLTIKPDWLDKRQVRGSPPAQQPFSAVIGNFTEYVEARNAPRPSDDFESPERPVQHLSFLPAK